MAFRERIRHLFVKLKRYLLTFNMFPSVPPSTDEHELCTQRISTRLFVFLLIVLLTILLLYTSLKTIRKTVNLQRTTVAQYERLYSRYSQTLTCACTKISINYDKFVHVNYTLHQLCSSIFVDQRWIDYLARSIYFETTLSVADFRSTSLSAFQALRAFCELTNSTISDNLIQFYSRQYVSASVIPFKLFQSETKSLIGQFRLSMINSFLLSLLIIRNTTQANALLSGRFTNYKLIRLQNDFHLEPIAKIYKACDCASSSTCIDQSSIYKYPSEIRLFNVPGFYTGCFAIESLLQSTLECFYNQQCIDELQVYLSSSPRMDVTALNSSLPSNYSTDSTVQNLVNNLMIEQWNPSSMYERYYNECQPTQCVYNFQTRNNVIYIVTTLFGIVGGLSTVLKFILPRLVKILRKKKEHPQAVTSKSKP
jgi:hypothetical protein